MTRTWEFSDNKAMPFDLVREQDFILRLRRLQRLGTPHFVVNLVLSAIDSLARNKGALEAVEAGLKELVKITGGTYAEMSNGDAFIIWEETSNSAALLQRLADVIKPASSGADRQGNYLITYNVPTDYMKLRERANEYVEMIQAAQTSPVYTPGPSEALLSEAARGPLTAWSVDQIGRLINEIDLQPYLRAQPIYKYEENNTWQSIRTEYYVSFNDLKRQRFPKIDVITPERLFLALCEIIDQKLLVELSAKPSAILGHPVNLNISVEAIVGASFPRFVRTIPAAQRSSIVFELHRGDLLVDFTRTLGAIDTLKEQGFQVAFDSITPDMMPYLNFNNLRFDYIKLNVARERTAQLSDSNVRKALMQIPLEKIIFFRCDNEAALRIGQSLGIRLFQGWLIDDLSGDKKKKT